MNWRLPVWDSDHNGQAARTEIPAAGGWIYRYRDGNGMFSHVFVPSLQVWVDAIAQAMSGKPRVVAVASNFAAATHKKQPVPGAKA